MKKLTTLFALIVALGILVSACKKKEENPPGADAKTQLQDKNWKLTGVYIIRINGIPYPLPQNKIDTIPDCYVDNLTIYQSNGDFVLDEGATKCSFVTPQRDTLGTWALGADNASLYITKSTLSVTDTMTITSISDSQMKLEGDASGLASVLEFLTTFGNVDLRLEYTKQ